MKKKSIISIIIIFCAVFGIYNFLSIKGIVLDSSLSNADKSVIKIGDTGYSNLKEAFEASKDGDILTLEEDIDITEHVTIPASKNLTLDLKGNTIVIATEKSNMRAVSVKGNGSFTIKNGKITAKDVDGDGYTSGFLNSEDSNMYMENIEVYNIKANVEGAVLNISPKRNVNIDIKNCHFHDNRSMENGGALKITTAKAAENSNFNIENNKFIKNRAETLGTVQRAAFGGAMTISGPGKFLIKGNQIIGNEAWAKNEYYNYGIYYSCGGGICFGGSVNIGGCEDVILEDNVISKNKAQFLGGGVSFQMEKKYDKITINSGVFSYNESEYSGGGIDLSIHNQPLVVMNNVIISGNKAYTGAGVWACPTSRVRNHSTYGAAILDNELQQIEKSVYLKSGTDVRYEGSDTVYKGISEGNNPDYHKISIQDRTFLGNRVNWYADEPNAPYKKGDKALTPDKYTDRTTSFGMLGKIESEEGWYKTHEKSARIIIVGNKAKHRGGGIATNTDLDFGQENLDVNVKASKVWKDKSGEELKDNHPKSVKVRLIRKDSDGGQYPLEEIELNSDNKWTHTFRTLPSEGIVEGKKLNFNYEVKETEVPKGYQCTVNEVEPSEGIKQEFVIENKEKPEKPPKPENPPKSEKPKTGDGKDMSNLIAFTVLSVLGITGVIIKKKKEN